MGKTFTVMSYDENKQEPNLTSKGGYVDSGKFTDLKKAITKFYELKKENNVALYIDCNGQIIFNGVNSDLKEVSFEEAENEIKWNVIL